MNIFNENTAPENSKTAGEEGGEGSSPETRKEPERGDWISKDEFHSALNSFAKRMKAEFVKASGRTAGPEKAEVTESPKELGLSKSSDDEIVKLRNENQEMKRFLMELKEERAQLQKKERELFIDSQLTSELDRLGVHPSAQKDVKASLRFYNVVQYDEEGGELVYKDDDEPLPLSLRDGLKKWAKSEAAQRYISVDKPKTSGNTYRSPEGRWSKKYSVDPFGRE